MWFLLWPGSVCHDTWSLLIILLLLACCNHFFPYVIPKCFRNILGIFLWKQAYSNDSWSSFLNRWPDLSYPTWEIRSQQIKGGVQVDSFSRLQEPATLSRCQHKSLMVNSETQTPLPGWAVLERGTHPLNREQMATLRVFIWPFPPDLLSMALKMLFHLEEEMYLK